MNRVVITGLGVVSPVGATLEEFWSAVVDGRSGIGQITIIPTERLNVRIAAQVGNFDPLAHFDPRRANHLDRVAQFAVVAARAAVRDAQIEVDEELSRKIACVVGTGVGGQNTQDDQYFRLYAQNSSKLHPLTIP